jgi:hypothetical protein
MLLFYRSLLLGHRCLGFTAFPRARRAECGAPDSLTGHGIVNYVARVNKGTTSLFLSVCYIDIFRGS